MWKDSKSRASTKRKLIILASLKDKFFLLGIYSLVDESVYLELLNVIEMKSKLKSFKLSLYSNINVVIKVSNTDAFLLCPKHVQGNKLLIKELIVDGL